LQITHLYVQKLNNNQTVKNNINIHKIISCSSGRRHRPRPTTAHCNCKHLAQRLSAKITCAMLFTFMIEHTETAAALNQGRKKLVWREKYFGF